MYHVQPSGVTWRDPESLEEVPLVPGLTLTQNALRWGFVQKVRYTTPADLAYSSSAYCWCTLGVTVKKLVPCAEGVPAYEIYQHAELRQDLVCMRGHLLGATDKGLSPSGCAEVSEHV